MLSLFSLQSLLSYYHVRGLLRLHCISYLLPLLLPLLLLMLLLLLLRPLLLPLLLLLMLLRTAAVVGARGRAAPLRRRAQHGRGGAVKLGQVFGLVGVAVVLRHVQVRRVRGLLQGQQLLPGKVWQGGVGAAVGGHVLDKVGVVAGLDADEHLVRAALLLSDVQGKLLVLVQQAKVAEVLDLLLDTRDLLIVLDAVQLAQATHMGRHVRVHVVVLQQRVVDGVHGIEGVLRDVKHIGSRVKGRRHLAPASAGGRACLTGVRLNDLGVPVGVRLAVAEAVVVAAAVAVAVAAAVAVVAVAAAAAVPPSAGAAVKRIAQTAPGVVGREVVARGTGAAAGTPAAGPAEASTLASSGIAGRGIGVTVTAARRGVAVVLGVGRRVVALVVLLPCHAPRVDRGHVGARARGIAPLLPPQRVGVLVDAGGQRLELLWRWWAQQGQSNEGQVSRPPSPVRVLCRPGGAPVSPLPERPAYGEQVGVSRPAVGGLLLGQPRLHLPAHSPPRQNALPPCKAAAGKLTHTGRHRGRWRER